MAKNNNCGNCKFGNATGRSCHEIPVIECRRFPPQQTGRQQAPEPYPFPVVVDNQWCGEHKLDGKNNSKD